jgi:hypothetical protein
MTEARERLGEREAAPQLGADALLLGEHRLAALEHRVEDRDRHHAQGDELAEEAHPSPAPLHTETAPSGMAAHASIFVASPPDTGEGLIWPAIGNAGPASLPACVGNGAKSGASPCSSSPSSSSTSATMLVSSAAKRVRRSSAVIRFRSRRRRPAAPSP